MPRIKDLEVPIAERWRKRIQAANVLNRLLDHYQGKLEVPLDTGQIQIGLRLLNKIMPDLKSMEVKGEINHTLNRVQLESRLIAMGRDPNEIWQAIEHRHKIANPKDNQALTLDHDASGDTQSPSDDTQVIDSKENNGRG